MQCSEFYRGKVKKGGRCKVCVRADNHQVLKTLTLAMFFFHPVDKCLDKQRTNVLRIMYTFLYFSILGNSFAQPIAFCVKQALPIHGHQNISSEQNVKGYRERCFISVPVYPSSLSSFYSFYVH